MFNFNLAWVEWIKDGLWVFELVDGTRAYYRPFDGVSNN